MIFFSALFFCFLSIPSFFSTENRIFIAGHNGMVGSALLRKLQEDPAVKILTVDRKKCDLTRQDQVEKWFEVNKPDYVYLAAAKVGGIHANMMHPAEFIYDNLMIESNIIHASYKNNVKKLLFLGTSCIYPRMASQPINEESLLSGYLEPTNEFYSLSKIAGIKLCEGYRKQYGCDFISAMPCNIYGFNDNFNLDSGHMVASMMNKIHKAKEAGDKSVNIWGTGTPKREFMFVDDLTDALVFLMDNYSDSAPINVGTGKDWTIFEYAQKIAGVVAYKGDFDFDATKPDGIPRKCLDTTRLTGLGWTPRTSLEEGLKTTYDWFLKNQESVRY